MFVAPGQTKTIVTHYRGQAEFTTPGKKRDSDKDISCRKWKCLHGPGFFAGDPRRKARHFLPSVDASFWKLPNGAPCTNPPNALIDKLHDLGCQEFVKYRKMQSGADITKVSCVFKDGQIPDPSPKKGSSRESLTSGFDLPTQGIEDKSRYFLEPTKTNDVSRLLTAAWQSGAISDNFIENFIFI